LLTETLPTAKVLEPTTEHHMVCWCTVCLAPQQDGIGVLFKAHQSVTLPSLLQELTPQKWGFPDDVL